MQKEGSEWGAEHCAVYLFYSCYNGRAVWTRDNAFGTACRDTAERARLGKETQTVTFSASFCCFDVTNSKCPIP